MDEDYPHYVRCKYFSGPEYPGSFSIEAAIQLNAEPRDFQSEGKAAFIVDKKDLLRINENDGLVKAVVIEITNNQALVGIVGMNSVPTFKVPREDVILSESELEAALA